MAFGVELSGQRNLCSEASGESALALKRTIGRGSRFTYPIESTLTFFVDDSRVFDCVFSSVLSLTCTTQLVLCSLATFR